jgi:hypothetical protein
MLAHDKTVLVNTDVIFTLIMHEFIVLPRAF